MEEFVKTLGDAERKKYRMFAYASTWFGCFSDVMIDNSAIIILYLALLGGSDALVMFSTGLVGILSMILLLPTARLVDRLGAKRVIAVSCYMACGSYMLMAAAPFFGDASAKYIAFGGCVAFCVSKPMWMGAWYPLLCNILLPGERGNFFGFMRFSYFTITGIAFFFVGVAMGKTPPVWLLQAVIAATGALVLGRNFFISKIRQPEHVPARRNLTKSLSVTLRNGSLVGFATYICFFSFAFMAVIPLSLVYLKSGLNWGDNAVQTVSSVGVAGLVSGFLLYGRLVRAAGMRNVQIGIHISYIIIPLGFFFCFGDLPYIEMFVAALTFAANFAYACFYCSFSQETLALAKPGNAPTATAFCQTYQMLGTAAGRSAVSFFLAGGILSPSWMHWAWSSRIFKRCFWHARDCPYSG